MIAINIDTKQIDDLLGLADAVKDMASTIGADVAAMVHAKATELAGQKLHSRREQFIKGLKPPRKSDDNVWIVALDYKVRWIDDGQTQYSMLKGLLGSKKVRRDKDGNRYIIVPFDHSPGRGKVSTTSTQQELINTVKGELKKRNIPFGKIENNGAGQPKMGKLHSFNIMGEPVKTKNGPGQGHGPIGAVKQGNTEIPWLQGVQIYQSPGKNGAKTKRSILTFRIASEKHADQGKWEHPGNAPMGLLEEAAEWAVENWKKEIAPAMLDKVVADL